MDQLQEETREALLTSIKAAVADTGHASTLLVLAEAYAWTVSPNQAHGGADG